MANVLNTAKQIAVIGALAEGSSIRSIERVTGIHRDTIMRLGVRVGQGCASLMDAKMRNLSCNRLEIDEIWGFVGKKDRNVRMGDSLEVGSVYTFCAIDADTKLVPAYTVGHRNRATAQAFMANVAGRMVNRVQISTDGFASYAEAVEKFFGKDVDYGQIVKVYGTYAFGERRYSTSGVISSEKFIRTGQPNPDLISTSYIERLNATTRLHMRRLTRLTHAFSKKHENFVAALGLHFAYYNFVRRHNTLRCTPAMAAGITSNFWNVGGSSLTYLEELREVIHKLHGATATHVKSVPVTETWKGQTVWDGVVEVFHLKGHPHTDKVYAWAHETDDPENPVRHVTVLHIPPAVSPETAVRAALVQEFRNAQA